MAQPPPPISSLLLLLFLVVVGQTSNTFYGFKGKAAVNCPGSPKGKNTVLVSGLLLKVDENHKIEKWSNALINLHYGGANAKMLDEEGVYTTGNGTKPHEFKFHELDQVTDIVLVVDNVIADGHPPVDYGLPHGMKSLSALKGSIENPKDIWKDHPWRPAKFEIVTMDPANPGNEQTVLVKKKDGTAGFVLNEDCADPENWIASHGIYHLNKEDTKIRRLYYHVNPADNPYLT